MRETRLMAEEDQLKAQRLRKRDALIEMGIDPYGGRFPNVKALSDVRRQAEPLGLGPGDRSDITARVAGRIMLLRVMGKLAFLTIRDQSGVLQLGLSKGELGDQHWAVVKKLDLGDILGADGIIGKTKTG